MNFIILLGSISYTFHRGQKCQKKIKYCPRRIKWAIGTEVSCGQRMTKKPKIQTQDAMDVDSMAQSLMDTSEVRRRCAEKDQEGLDAS